MDDDELLGTAGGVGATSAPGLLALHAVRVLGMTDAPGAADRYGLDAAETAELLLDFEAHGWVMQARTAAPGVWSLTPAGRAEGERRLAAELRATGAREPVLAAYRDFEALNARFLRACTDWQIHPTPWDALAANEHDDWRWDERVLDELSRLGRYLVPVEQRLASALRRFAGYGDRYLHALRTAELGDLAWVDGVAVDSCHRVWFELHEDLLATLGIERGEAPGAEG